MLKSINHFWTPIDLVLDFVSARDREKPEYGAFQQCEQCGRIRMSEVLRAVMEAKGLGDHRTGMPLADLRRG
jgi:hypothetical protein